MGAIVKWTEERKARAALTWVCPLGNVELAASVADYGAADVFAALRESGESGSWPARAKTVDTKQLIKDAKLLGIRFLIPTDDEWPTQLASLSGAKIEGQLGGVPLGIWARGPGNLAELSVRSVAIVGARASSRYGESVAGEFAADLAEPASGQEWTVISGGAYGIDAAAHRGALAVNGATIGVFGGGLHESYPPGNGQLFGRLVEENLVISEVAPGMHPTRRGFLARNRLIAALSLGTLVVEAAARSGAKNTARWAAELSRVVMAVPGSVHSTLSVTPHQLIRDGVAMLVTSADEVRALVGAMDANKEESSRSSPTNLDRLSPAQFQVREVLPSRGGLSLGEVSVFSGFSIPETVGILSELVALGLAKEKDGRWRV